MEHKKLCSRLNSNPTECVKRKEGELKMLVECIGLPPEIIELIEAAVEYGYFSRDSRKGLVKEIKKVKVWLEKKENEE